jgi:hypothetical protein
MMLNVVIAVNPPRYLSSLRPTSQFTAKNALPNGQSQTRKTLTAIISNLSKRGHAEGRLVEKLGSVLMFSTSYYAYQAL